MKQHHFLIFLLIVGANILMGTQCRRDFITPDPVYKYSEKLSLTPYKKIYSINDTIWVQFHSTDKSLYDELSDQRVPADTAYLHVMMHYTKHYRIGTTSEFFCNVIVDNNPNPDFTISATNNNDLNFTTACHSDNFFFRVGFIPIETGIYSINYRIQTFDCPNKIVRNHTTTHFTFDLDDCNKDVWLSIPRASRGGENGSSIDKKETFYFKVQ